MLIQQPRLAIPLEFLKRNYQLSKDLEERCSDCAPPWIAIVTALPSGWAHLSWLPVVRFEDEAQFTAHRLKVARRGALGIADLGRIRGYGFSLFAVFFRNHFKNLGEFGESHFPRFHQRIAARNGWNLCYPPFSCRYRIVLQLSIPMACRNYTPNGPARDLYPLAFCNSSVIAGITSKISPTTP